MSIAYEAVKNDQSTLVLYRGAILDDASMLETTFAYVAQRAADSSETKLVLNVNMLADVSTYVPEIDRIMHRVQEIVADQELRDEGEPAPPQDVIDQFEEIIRRTSALTPILPGQISVFFGELNMTWRSGDRIVRFACFPGRPSVLQIGSISMPVGSYQSQTNPTPEMLAERLSSFATEIDQENPPFLG